MVHSTDRIALQSEYAALKAKRRRTMKAIARQEQIVCSAQDEVTAAKALVVGVGLTESYKDHRIKETTKELQTERECYVRLVAFRLSVEKEMRAFRKLHRKQLGFKMFVRMTDDDREMAATCKSESDALARIVENCKDGRSMRAREDSMTYSQCRFAAAARKRRRQRTFATVDALSEQYLAQFEAA